MAEDQARLRAHRVERGRQLVARRVLPAHENRAHRRDQPDEGLAVEQIAGQVDAKRRPELARHLRDGRLQRRWQAERGSAVEARGQLAAGGRPVADRAGVEFGPVLKREDRAAPAQLRINRLDDPQARDESGLHLTVTGLSGEMGDDGQVGRGNRVSGLIAPGRAMSREAAAGKNPVSHVGKIYNLLATLIARDIHAKVEGAAHVSVQLLSAIGEPIDQLEIAGIEIHASEDLNVSMRSRAAEIADAWLADIQQVTELILAEKIAMY